MNIYFSGIGGVGIGPLAEIAADAGHDVLGTDLVETLVTEKLRKKGIAISNNQDGSFLLEKHQEKPIDWFIYTSALQSDHPELALAKKLGIKTAKRDELLAYIIRENNLKLIAVAGTHGKTTTTGMIIWTMQNLGIPISYSIGTTISFGPGGKFDPASEYFIYECDEFDRNFLHFEPYLSLITSLDYDHPDTYPTQENYLEAFKEFAGKSQSVIAWEDQHGEIFDDMANVSLIGAKDVDDSLRLAGKHNRRNATLVELGLKKLGINQDISKILEDFPGTDRRFEKLANNLYSDYAHHPSEIGATLQMASELSSHIVLVYQPHQNVRQYSIRDQYTDQFEPAEIIYWLPTYLTRQDHETTILKPEELIQNITNKDKIVIADFNDELWQNIQAARKAGKMVIMMGAGLIDTWARQNLAKEN